MSEVPEIYRAMGKISSGLFIVTAAHDGNRGGYLASWIQQVSFSPLMVSLAMKPGRPCYDLIKTHGRFCINIIGHKNEGVMKPFWSPNAEKDPFDGLDYVVTPSGNLVLRSAMAALECEVRSTTTPGDHEILFAEVMAGQEIQVEDKPLNHVRKSGLQY